jgi:hypothetical protein
MTIVIEEMTVMVGEEGKTFLTTTETTTIHAAAITTTMKKDAMKDIPLKIDPMNNLNPILTLS